MKEEEGKRKKNVGNLKRKKKNNASSGVDFKVVICNKNSSFWERCVDQIGQNGDDKISQVALLEKLRRMEVSVPPSPCPAQHTLPPPQKYAQHYVYLFLEHAGQNGDTCVASWVNHENIEGWLFGTVFYLLLHATLLPPPLEISVPND